MGDALLDQRNLAGIGNLWKAEACFATRLDPWRRVGDVSDEEALEVARAAREAMRHSALHGTRVKRHVFERGGLPCPRCGTLVRGRGQGDDNRTTWWCPGCQA